MIADYASDCEVLKVGSTNLVELAERKLNGESFDPGRLESILKPILDCSSIDVLVLACTHFPLLTEEIKVVFNRYEHPIQLVDSTKGIANRVSDLSQGLTKQTFDKNMSEERSVTRLAVFTMPNSKQVSYLSKLNMYGFNEIQTLLITT